MTKRRRQRTSRPIPEEASEAGDVGDQPTIPLNIAPIGDWRTQTDVHAAKTRISWGMILSTRQRAVDHLGAPLRFIPTTVAEIMRLWYQVGGQAHTIAHSPLLLVRISASGLAPLILLSIVALSEMEDRPEVADRVRFAIDLAVTWIQNRGQRGFAPANSLLLVNCPCPYPISYLAHDDLQLTPAPFHSLPQDPGKDTHERGGDESLRRQSH